jgi:hypothetical protein
MNPIKRPVFSLRNLQPAFVLTLLGVLLFSQVKAQNILAPAPENPATPPAVQEYQTSEMDVFTSELPESVEQESEPFRLGMLNFRPHPYYRFLYGTGIQAAPGQQYSTVLNQISPGFLLEIGGHWSLDYTPTWNLYSNSHFRDALDHSVNLSGVTAYGDWTFGILQSCIISSDPLAETGEQTDLETYSTALKASYQFNSKFSTDLEADQNLAYADNNQNATNTDNLQDSHEWGVSDWVNYQFWPRLVVGAGVSFGYDNVTGDSGTNTSYDMTFQQYQARVAWRATDKVSFQIHGGLEDRQFFNGGSGDLLNPIFGAVIQYLPFENTRISFTADREVGAAYVSGQTLETTEVGASISQRLFKKFYLGVNAGYENIPYVAASNLTQGRTDNYYTFATQLSCQFLTRGRKHGTIAVSYQGSKDSSTLAGYSFSSSQFGLEIGYRY